MDGVSCAPLLPVNLVSRGKRDAMINALFQNTYSTNQKESQI
jgi:hypothetical protein